MQLYFEESDALTVTLTVESEAVAFGVQSKGAASKEELAVDTDYSPLKST